MSEASRDRVGALFAGARRTFRPRAGDELHRRIALETGLSVPGVVHALEHVLEVDAAESELDAFVDRARLAGEAPAIAIVLAANVFTAPLRAIAWALARSPRVVVRPSRRGQLFPTVLASAARGAFELAKASDDPSADLASLLDTLPTGSGVHVYGGAEALDAVRATASARPGLGLELHGPGFGVIVGEATELAAQADAIALDVAAFDQRGCLSPRLAFAIGSRDRAAAACDALHAALGRIGERIPRGTATAYEAGAIRLARETAEFHGRALSGAHHLVLDLGDAPDAPIGPTFRTLPVVAVRDTSDALRRLAHVAARLTVIGAPTGTLDPGAVRALAPGARLVPLGTMQRPPLAIGPVDLRHLESQRAAGATR